DEFTEIGGPDDAARENARIEVTRRMARLARLSKNLADLEEKIASTPKRYINVRAKLIAQIPRLQVKCSQELRRIPFHAAQWRLFRSSLEHALAEINWLERELKNPQTESVSVRSLKRRIREYETAAGANACQMGH